METRKNNEKYIIYYVQFKSYYVVWKPGTKSADSAARKSLNRTMQYGNFSQMKKTAQKVAV